MAAKASVQLVNFKTMDITKAIALLKDHGDRHANDKYYKSIIDMSGALKSKEFTLLTAQKYLSRYLANGGEKTGNPDDLLKACHYILFELQNRIDSNK